MQPRDLSAATVPTRISGPPRSAHTQDLALNGPAFIGRGDLALFSRSIRSNGNTAVALQFHLRDQECLRLTLSKADLRPRASLFTSSLAQKCMKNSRGSSFSM